MGSMKTMAISEFRVHASLVLGDIARTKESVVVTNRGVPVVEVIPFRRHDDRQRPGKLAGALVFEADAVSPVAEHDWEACK